MIIKLPFKIYIFFFRFLKNIYKNNYNYDSFKFIFKNFTNKYKKMRLKMP
jgi:hypothetical protein